MMNFDGQECRESFEKAFGKPINELTVDQVRWIVNVAKHCRGRCRSNAALNNYLNRNFTGHQFKEVPVLKQPSNELDYMKLEITLK